ncbi:MAG: hypothetical protein GY932_04380 [Arcobacter sp.]|nr:hypothetical protein [Arcobacter sp.]
MRKLLGEETGSEITETGEMLLFSAVEYNNKSDKKWVVIISAHEDTIFK